LGGVTVNFFVAVAIYAGMGAYYGEKYVDTADLKGGIWATPVAQSMGMKSGDVPVAVGGREIARFDEVSVEMLLGSGSSLTVLRGGERIELPITQEFVAKAIEEKTPWMFPRVPYVVKEFATGSPAEAAGMLKGDALVALNGEPLTYFDEYLERIPALAGKTATITVDRAGERVDLPVTVSDAGKIGVYYQDNLAAFFPVKTDYHSGLAALPYGWNRAVSTLSSYARQIKLMFQPETGAYKEAGGFLTILKQYPSSWDWEHFWGFTAFLSLALAFLNVLPIPALDGGHAVFALIEWVTGRAPSTRVMEVAQMIGFFLLLALFVLANGNDLFKALGL
jgi:regulator of sigma E protease